MRSSLTVRIDNGRIIFGESFFSAADCRDRKDMSNIGWPVGSDEMTNCSKIVTYFQAQPIISRVLKFHQKSYAEQGLTRERVFLSISKETRKISKRFENFPKISVF